MKKYKNINLNNQYILENQILINSICPYCEFKLFVSKGLIYCSSPIFGVKRNHFRAFLYYLDKTQLESLQIDLINRINFDYDYFSNTADFYFDNGMLDESIISNSTEIVFDLSDIKESIRKLDIFKFYV